MRRLNKILIIGTISALLLAFLEYKGIIWHNSIFAMKYEIKGLDVSHHQGEIDWEKIKSKAKYFFVFIKATEGHDYVDDKFDYNWKEAKKQGFFTGAYHFFSMRSSGAEQANNFINTVPQQIDNLPPVIDIEIHLKHDPKIVREELLAFANRLEKYYEKKPILYVTYDTYNTYIKGAFNEYDLWIRDILKFPTTGDRNWLIWQYCNRGRIEGIDMYADINVFNGNMEEFIRRLR